MKLFIAGLATETNTFSPMPTGLADYTQVRGVTAETAGMFEMPLAVWRSRAEERGWTVAESLCAFAAPAGLTPGHVYERFRDEILADLQAALPVDAVLLGLHGAMVAGGYDDCEGDLLARVRALVGPDVPVGAELDLHCHVTPAMLANATALVLYKEFPHTDFAERAEELFTIIADAAAGKVKPTTGVFDLRMIGGHFTTLEPMKGYLQRVRGLEGQDGVLSISIAHGFPYADVPDLGGKLLVVTDNRPEQATALARELGLTLIKLKGRTTPPFLPLDEALDQALAAPAGPVVLSDGADNPGGGAPGDSTFVLRRLLERGVDSAGIACLWDPVAVQLALAAGDGARLRVRLGGKMGPTSGDPVDLDCTVVRARRDVKQRYSGAVSSIGDAAALRCGGIDVIVASRRNQARSPDVFSELGVDPTAKRILVVKSRNHFRAEFETIAADILYLDADGALSPDLRRVPYTRIQRPKWPMDADAHAEWGL